MMTVLQEKHCAAATWREEGQGGTPLTVCLRAMKVGDTLTVRRAFTNAEILAFGDMTLDRAPWHVQPDAQGRLVVHGMLTTSLCTAIGGALGFLARQFDMTLIAPVRTGEVVTCTYTLTALSEAASPGAALLGQQAARVTRCEGTAELTNDRNEALVRVYTKGLIPRPLAEVEAHDVAETQAKLSDVAPLSRARL